MFTFLPLSLWGKSATMRTKEKNKSAGYWACELDSGTKHYGFKTYRQFFAHKIKNVLGQNEFNDRLAHVKIQYVTDEDFLYMNIGNERLERYWDKKTPEDVYPVGDRPRGHLDIQVIYDLMKTEQPVPPVLLGIVTFQDGFEQIIVLDGMHRIIAAHLIQKPFALVIVDLR